MDPNLTRTASQLASDAEHISSDARQAVQGYVSESKKIIDDAAASIRPRAEEFKDLASEAMDTAAGLARDAGDLSSGAAKAAKAYASRSAQAGRAKAMEMTDATRQFVASNPLMSALAAVATGAALMVLARHAMKGRHHA